jgi:hypothetical protein
MASSSQEQGIIKEKMEYTPVFHPSELRQQLESGPDYNNIKQHLEGVLHILEKCSEEALHVIHANDTIDIYAFLYAVYLKVQREFLKDVFIIVNLTPTNSSKDECRRMALINSFRRIFGRSEHASNTTFVQDPHKRVSLLIMPIDPDESSIQEIQSITKEKGKGSKRRKSGAFQPSPLSRVVSAPKFSQGEVALKLFRKSQSISTRKSPLSRKPLRVGGKNSPPVGLFYSHKQPMLTHSVLASRIPQVPMRGITGKKRKRAIPTSWLFEKYSAKPVKEFAQIAMKLTSILRQRSNTHVIWHELAHPAYLNGILALQRHGDIDVFWRAILGHNLIDFPSGALL